MKSICPMTIIVHNILHTVYLIMLKHLMDWVMSFQEQHSSSDILNQFWEMMPPYSGVAWFNKPYHQVMHWCGKEVKGLGHVIVLVFAATVLNPLVSQSIPFTEALLCLKNFVYFHLMVQYWYHTEATIEYMENYLEEFHFHKVVFSWFCANQSTKKVSEALKKQLTLDKQQKQESNPAWDNLSASAKHHRIHQNQMQVNSDIAKRIVDKSNFNFVTMRLLKTFWTKSASLSTY